MGGKRTNWRVQGNTTTREGRDLETAVPDPVNVRAIQHNLKK